MEKTIEHAWSGGKPIGLCEYQIYEKLPKKIKTALPSIEELETEFARDLKL